MQTVVKFIFLFFISFLLAGCGEEEVTPYEFNGKELNKLVNSYLAGDSTANSLLGLLFNYADPKLIEVNSLIIDSIVFGRQNTVYYLLLESSNPAFNLFTVIDKNMNVLLKDNSLNGYLSLNFQDINNKNYAVIREDYQSRDTVNIQRTSLYEIKSDYANIIFRSITEFIYGKMKISSSITQINNKELKLSFKPENTPLFNYKEDVFSFDAVTRRYISSNNYLRNFVVEQIDKIKTKSALKEITDKNYYERILSGQKENLVNTDLSKNDYSISLSNDWREFENFTVTKFLKEEFVGYKYFNEKIGASISLIKIPDNKQTDLFLDYQLSKKEIYEHPVRYIDLIESGKSFVSFYEFSCNGKKFLLILEAPKFTYESNLSLYLNILKKFKINC